MTKTDTKYWFITCFIDNVSDVSDCLTTCLWISGAIAQKQTIILCSSSYNTDHGEKGKYNFTKPHHLHNIVVELVLNRHLSSLPFFVVRYCILLPTCLIWYPAPFLAIFMAKLIRSGHHIVLLLSHWLHSSLIGNFSDIRNTRSWPEVSFGCRNRE